MKRSARPAVTVVIVTHNRAEEVLQTVRRTIVLPDAARIVVVDNASDDGTAALLRSQFPFVPVVRSGTNLGAAARNIGLAIARTPFVALCDDDTWWEPGALSRAVHVIARDDRIAIVCARVVVEPCGVTDPTSTLMAASPLDSTGLPGQALLGFLAGACVVRRSAVLQAGGFDARLFIGGEEELLAYDLAARGWRMVYVPDLVVHHAPSLRRNAVARRDAAAKSNLHRVAAVAREGGDPPDGSRTRRVCAAQGAEAGLARADVRRAMAAARAPRPSRRGRAGPPTPGGVWRASGHRTCPAAGDRDGAERARAARRPVTRNRLVRHRAGCPAAKA